MTARDQGTGDKTSVISCELRTRAYVELPLLDTSPVVLLDQSPHNGLLNTIKTP